MEHFVDMSKITTHFEPLGNYEKTILDYKNKEHIDFLTHLIRHKPEDDTKYAAKLSQNGELCVYSYAPRVYVNMLIFQKLDEYSVPDIPDIRKPFVFDESYLKGRPFLYMERISDHLRKINLPNEELWLPYLLAEIKQVFYLLAVIVNGVVSVDHSLMDYLDAYRTLPEFKDLIDKPSILPIDTPFEQKRKLNNIHNMLLQSAIHPASDFLKSGVKCNSAQLRAIVASYGMTPNPLSVNKCNRSIMGGYLNGLVTRHDFLSGDNIARMVNVLSKQEIQDTGLTVKRTVAAINDVKLNATDTRAVIHDCGTSNTWPVHISDKSDLKFLRYKYFYNPKTKKLEYIDTDRTDLYGKDIEIRTFMLCDGETVCEIDFGYNAKFVQDNEIHKNNLSTWVVHIIAKIAQGVISINTGASKTILYA